MTKSKNELLKENRELLQKVQEQQKIIDRLEALNRTAFKLQHDAERRLNALYANK